MLIVCQALNHPYFFALPYPTHPSKLPRPAVKQETPPLADVDNNAVNGKKKSRTLKRKLESPMDDATTSAKVRSIARRLDFGALPSNGS